MSDSHEAKLALANAAYRHDLGDGLLLRWSTAADTERLTTFYGQAFRRSEQAPPSTRLLSLVPEMMSGRSPLVEPEDFALVEDTATGAIVAATVLLKQAWEYDGIRFPIGRPEIVASLPDYRRRGLVREIFRLIHARSNAQGHLAQGITGINWYYRQFGYEYAIELENGVRVTMAEIPPAREGEPEPFRLRPAAEDDLPLAARFYDEERASAHVSTPIDAAYWRFGTLEARPESDVFPQVSVIEDAGGAAVGYTFTGQRAFEGMFDVYGLWLRPGLWLAALPALLRAYVRLGEQARERGDNTPLHLLAFALPQGHPALAALPALVNTPPFNQPYAWYVRVADLPALLRTLAPALERRLAGSPFAGYSGALALDFYRGGLRMVWRDGRLAEVGDWQKPIYGEGDAGFPPLVFLQMLFGYRNLDELRHAFPDVWAKGEARALLPTLFPQRASWVVPLG